MPTEIAGDPAALRAAAPTMPWFWRGGLVVGGVVVLAIAWQGLEDLSSSRSSLIWIVVLPLALVGGSVWGAVVNHSHGVTSSRPGWVGAGGAPPPRPISFLIPPTAGARSRLALHPDTSLAPNVVLDAVRRTTAVRGNWFVVFGDHVEVADSPPGEVGLHIGGHCFFRARVERRGGRTVVRVGGMDRWVQRRSYYAWIIPAGLAHVQGFWMYKLFLQTVGAEIARLDPYARLGLGGPSKAETA